MPIVTIRSTEDYSPIMIGDGHPLAVIAGPCVVENRDMIMSIAEIIAEIARKLSVPFIFKSSYKKANRTSTKGFVTIGMEKALSILAEVKREFKLPILTDIHTPEEAKIASETADILQIPAFLCRQSDILYAAGETGKTINIKKGQFLAPDDVRYPIEKVTSTGNQNVLITERGASFGYHNLVVDMRGLAIMRQYGFPVVLDATHSLQLPSGGEGKSGGQPQFIFPIARAGVAAGIDALFIETHPDPPNAMSDAATQLPLAQLELLIRQVKAIDDIVKDWL